MQKPKPVRFRFGRFEANLLTRSLFEDGKRVPLQEKPFQLLSAVLMGRGNVVTREEVAAIMWPHTHVQTDQGLNAATRKVRLALGDSPEEPKYLETLGSRGYRFIYPVEVIETLETTDADSAAGQLRVAILPVEDQGGFSKDLVCLFSAELTSLLGRVAPQLTIVSNGEIRDLNLQSSSISEIGRELQVEYVICPRVRRLPNKLRITTMLFESDDTQCIWAETYEDAPESFATNRGVIAEKIARSLLSRLADSN